MPYLANEGWLKTNITAAGSTIVDSSPGVFHQLVVNDGVAKTITLQDATVSAGATAFATMDAPTKGVYSFDCLLSAGLVVSSVSATNLTVLYR